MELIHKTTCVRLIARILEEGLHGYLYACMVWGHAPPIKFLCSEIAAEAILGQKQSHSSYMHGSRSIASNLGLFMCVFTKPADFKFP